MNNKKLLFDIQCKVTNAGQKTFSYSYKIGWLVLQLILFLNLASPFDSLTAANFTTATLVDNTGTYPFLDAGTGTIFSLDSTNNEALDINGQKIYVRGNIFFTAQANEVFTVNIGNATASGSYVSIQPVAKRVVVDGTSTAPVESTPGVTTSPIAITEEQAQLIFCPSAGGQIEVNVFSDFLLTGSNYSTNGVVTLVGALPGTTTGQQVTFTPQDLSTDITMTFTGQGQTIFNLSDGQIITFESQAYDTATANHNTTVLPTGKGAGARVLVAMDDSYANVVGSGNNKVIFQRASYAGTTLDTRVRIGINSFFTFVSNSISGTANESYAAVAFDCSGSGMGRLELQVTGNNVVNSYQDGAFIIGGNFLGAVDDGIATNNIAPGSYSNPYDFLGEAPSSVTGVTATGIDFSQPAGDQAIIRIIDNLAYFSSTDYKSSVAPANTNPGTSTAGNYTRRGLLVSNKVLSISPMASNPYLDGGWFVLNSPEIDITQTGSTTTRTVFNKVSPYRYGFILAVNGAIDVSHNMFMEYVALSFNMSITPNNISNPVGTSGATALSQLLSSANVTVSDSVFKQHNPSALIVDGLYIITDPTTGNVQTQFEGASSTSSVYRHATITLFGNASLSLRGDVLGTRVDGTGYDPAQPYNGLNIPYPNQYNSSGTLTSYGETPGEGIHVMDIEGLFEIRSQDDTALPAAVSSDYGWHTRSGYTVRPGSDLTQPLQGGIVRLPTLVRNAADQELVTITDTVLGTRPLTIGTLYSRYDKPAILANASFDFKNVRFINDDVARNVTYSPSTAQPIIMGGERAHFLSVVDNETSPDIAFWRLYSSEIHCSESMCVAGLRIIVRELPTYQEYVPTESVNNMSSIYFYNHGNTLDTNLRGYGRLLLLGSALNVTGNQSTSQFLEDAFINVFRHTGRIHGSTGAYLNNIVDLSLRTKFESSTTVPADQKSMHMLILGMDSYLDVGWTSTEGILQNTDDATGYTIYPFDHVDLSTVKEDETFTIRTDSQDYNSLTQVYTPDPGELPASFTLNGDFLFLGAEGADGSGSPKVVNSYNLGRVIYVDHGGKMTIGSDTSVTPNKPYIGFSSATIAISVWKDANSDRGLNPIIVLPGDQMKLSNPVSPYNIDMNVLTDSLNPYFDFTTLTGKDFGTEVRIAWDKVKNINSVPFMSPNFLTELQIDYNNLSRAINDITTPITMPASGLIRMTTGDYLDQLSISGATPASPFRIYMSGDNNGISQIREVVSVQSDTLVPGEGAFGKFYMDQGARLGLGNRSWNSDSINAWTKIGTSEVTIYANGNCQIDVNSNLIVVDPQPIIPTTNFGSDIPNPAVGAPAGSVIPQTHQITFSSVGPNEIRIPSGQSLDLSAFGKANTTSSGAVDTQQIAIAGQIKLIFEPGSELRFPDLGDQTASGNTTDNAPILYLNEESEIIFEAASDIAQKAPFQSLADTNRAKIRILGCGQIWFNKTAQMKIQNGAIVAIESDAQTPNTNITFSIQREGQVAIGDFNTAGGSFQIGNPVAVPNSNIDFTLRLNGEESRFDIGRNGFFGIGVGTVLSTPSKINSWTVAPLTNVRTVALRNIQGTISHNRIYDGTSAESSLFAIGPCEAYIVEQGPTKSYIMGGGSVLYLRSDVATIPYPVSILSTAVPLAGSVLDNGKYSILLPTQTLRQMTSTPSSFSSTSTVQVINANNSSYLGDHKLTTPDIPLLTGGLRFLGEMADTFTYLVAGGVTEIRHQTPSAYVALGHTLSEDKIGYVNDDATSVANNGGNIVRSTSIIMKSGEDYTASLPYGALKVANTTGIFKVGNPVNYTSVKS